MTVRKRTRRPGTDGWLFSEDVVFKVGGDETEPAMPEPIAEPVRAPAATGRSGSRQARGERTVRKRLTPEPEVGAATALDAFPVDHFPDDAFPMAHDGAPSSAFRPGRPSPRRIDIRDMAPAEPHSRQRPTVERQPLPDVRAVGRPRVPPPAPSRPGAGQLPVTEYSPTVRVASERRVRQPIAARHDETEAEPKGRLFLRGLPSMAATALLVVGTLGAGIFIGGDLRPGTDAADEVEVSVELEASDPIALPLRAADAPAADVVVGAKPPLPHTQDFGNLLAPPVTKPAPITEAELARRLGVAPPSETAEPIADAAEAAPASSPPTAADQPDLASTAPVEPTMAPPVEPDVAVSQPDAASSAPATPAPSGNGADVAAPAVELPDAAPATTDGAETTTVASVPDPAVEDPSLVGAPDGAVSPAGVLEGQDGTVEAAPATVEAGPPPTPRPRPAGLAPPRSVAAIVPPQDQGRLAPDPTPTGSLPTTARPDFSLPAGLGNGPVDTPSAVSRGRIVGRIIPPEAYEAPAASRPAGRRVIGRIIPPEEYDGGQRPGPPAGLDPDDALVPPLNVGPADTPGPQGAIVEEEERYDLAYAGAPAPAAVALAPPAAPAGDLRIVIHVPEQPGGAVGARLGRTVDALPGDVEVKVVGAHPATSSVRYFHPEDRVAAQALRRQLAAAEGDWDVGISDFTTYRPQPRKGLIEVWLKDER